MKTVLNKISIVLILVCMTFILTSCATSPAFAPNEVAPVQNVTANSSSVDETVEQVTGDVSLAEVHEVDDVILSGAHLPAVIPDAFFYDSVPEYSGDPFVKVNNGEPYFGNEYLSTTSYEYYSELDSLGRCGTCVANIGEDLMPTGERGEIGSVKPSGWQSVKYDCVDGKYLYNRSHLIGWQLTGENANKQNLITGTRYFNVIGMLPYENLIAEFVEDYHQHVLYRVSPIFVGDELVARGLLMEGISCEDAGKSVKFCVFCYNVQPGVVIDYKTGDSYEDGSQPSVQSGVQVQYILNTSSMKFHLPKNPALNAHSFRGGMKERQYLPSMKSAY